MATVLVVSVLVGLVLAGCGDTAPVDEGPSVPLLSCSRGEFDAFPEARLSDDLLSRDELVELPIGAALAAGLPEVGSDGEDGFYSTADGFLILDDGLIGSAIDGHIVGSFYLQQEGAGWVLQKWG